MKKIIVQHKYNNIKRYILYLAIFTLLIIFFLVFKTYIIQINSSDIEQIIKENNKLGGVIYFIICFLQPIFIPLPEPVVIIAGTAALGPLYGYIIGYVGTLLGIITMFFIMRIGGIKIANKFSQENKLKMYRKLMSKKEGIVLFMLFLVPILPDEVVSIGAGLSSIQFKKFLPITTLAKAISVLLYSQSLSIGKYFELNMIEWLLIIIAIIIFFEIVIKKIYNKKYKD